MFIHDLNHNNITLRATKRISAHNNRFSLIFNPSLLLRLLAAIHVLIGFNICKTEDKKNNIQLFMLVSIINNIHKVTNTLGKQDHTTVRYPAPIYGGIKIDQCALPITLNIVCI